MGDDFDNLRIRVTGMLECRDISIVHLPAFMRQLDGETHGYIRLDVVGATIAVGHDLRVVEPGAFAGELAMRRQAVAAAINLGDGERNPFAGRRGQGTFAERGGKTKIGFQRRRAVGDNFEQVRHRAELLLDRCEQGPRLIRSLLDGRRGNAGHGFHLRWDRPRLANCRMDSSFHKTAEDDKTASLISVIWKDKMDRFEAMRALVAAVDGGSLSAAARSLDAPLSTVSRRVSDLEAQLGSQLVIRTSRKLLLTEAGAAYVASARRVLEVLAEAESAASGEYRTARGELVVTAPIAFGALNVAPIVHDFLAAYPEVSVRLVLSDGVIDLVESHIDLAVRIGALPDSTLVARRVGAIKWVICARPDYLHRRGEPRIPAELADHDCIAFEGLQRYRDWPFASKNGVQLITITPRFSVNTADGVIGGAAAGLGIARLMCYQAAASVREELLVPILSDWSPPPIPVHLVYAPRQQQPVKLRTFLDYVAPRLKERLRVIAEQFGPTKTSASTPRQRERISDVG